MRMSGPGEKLLGCEDKFKTSVQRHSHVVKGPLFGDGWFLKKAERLEARGYMILLAVCSIVYANGACDVPHSPFPHRPGAC